jgi:hypothetical protein
MWTSLRLAHSPTAEQNQTKRTFDVLPKPDNFIRYRHKLHAAICRGLAASVWRSSPQNSDLNSARDCAKGFPDVCCLIRRLPGNSMADTVQSPAEKLKVFISYARADGAALAEDFVMGLGLAGFAPFLDRHDIAAAEDWEPGLAA